LGRCEPQKMRHFYLRLRTPTSRVSSYSNATAHVQNCLNPSPSAQSHPIPKYRSSVTPMLDEAASRAARQLDRTTQVALTVDHLTSRPALRRRRLPCIEISAPPATAFAHGEHLPKAIHQCTSDNIAYFSAGCYSYQRGCKTTESTSPHGASGALACNAPQIAIQREEV